MNFTSSGLLYLAPGISVVHQSWEKDPSLDSTKGVVLEIYLYNSVSVCSS